MDSYQALRRDLEKFANQLKIENFQALNSGLGLGKIYQKNPSIESNESLESMTSQAMMVKSSVGVRDSRISFEKPGLHSTSHQKKDGSGAAATSIAHSIESFSHNSIETLEFQKADQNLFENVSAATQSQMGLPNQDYFIAKPLNSTVHQESLDGRTVRSSSQSSLDVNSTSNQRKLSGAAASTRNSVTYEAGAHAVLKTPIWAWLVGHLADLFMVAICILVCVLGMSLILSDFKTIRSVHFGPSLCIALIYGTLIVYGLIFKILGLPLIGSLIRRKVTSRSQGKITAPISI